MPDLERAIKAGCNNRNPRKDCRWPDCTNPDACNANWVERLQAAFAALDPPSAGVVKALARLRCDRNGYKQITAREREHTAEDIRAYLAAIRGER